MSKRTEGQGRRMMTKEYIFGIEEEEIDEEEVFYGWIRKHSPELIRCKDCKKFVAEKDQAYCLDMYGQCDENGFCAWAERKEE